MKSDRARDPGPVRGAAAAGRDSQPAIALQAGRGRWFARGWLVGALLWATANSLSYFVRSDGVGNLLGRWPERQERLGFPWQVWERTGGGIFEVDSWAMGRNALAGVLAGCFTGIIAARCQGWLNRRMAAFEQPEDPSPQPPWQFSLRGLMLATTAAAVLAAVAGRALAGQPAALGFIFALGPWALVAVAMAPRRLCWEHRVALLLPLCGLMIAAAIAIGGTLRPSRLFDDVLLGIFVCWTPQCSLAALVLTAGLLAAPESHFAASGADRHASL